MTSNGAVTFLRCISGLVMCIGACTVIDGLMNYRTVPLFMFDVPGWIIGASAIYMGLRYWRRIPEMEKNVAGTQFSWSNFSIFKTKTR
ncbi:MAG: hypothetical protein WCT04_25230 [Planctomycetota bacterium]